MRSACWARGLSCWESAKTALLLDLLVVGEAEDRVQGSDRPVGADLGQPEDGLAAHLRVGVAPNRLQQDVLGSRLILLGHQEDGLPAEAGRGRIAPREHPTQDGAGPGLVHLLQRVECGHLHVVIIAGSNDRAARAGRAPRVDNSAAWAASVV